MLDLTTTTKGNPRLSVAFIVLILLFVSTTTTHYGAFAHPVTSEFCQSYNDACWEKSLACEECQRHSVLFVCKNSANGNCISCSCGNVQVFSPLACSTVRSLMNNRTVADSRPRTTPTPHPSHPTPSIPHRGHGNNGSPGPSDQHPSGTRPAEEAKQEPAEGKEAERSRAIGGGVGGTVGGIIVLATVTTFFVTRKRRRFDFPRQESQEELTLKRDESADEEEDHPKRSAPSMTTVANATPSPMPPLVLLARSDTLSRAKPSNVPQWTAPSLTGAVGSIGTASPEADTSMDHPGYLQQQRERQEMKRHWRKTLERRSKELDRERIEWEGLLGPKSPAPAATRDSPLARNIGSNRTSNTAPLRPSPLRSASIVSMSTTSTNSDLSSSPPTPIFYPADRLSVSTTSSTSSYNYLILSSHKPERNDELEVSVGDRVSIWRVWEDGWCHGGILEKGGTCAGREGVFPIKCVRVREGEDGERGTICGDTYVSRWDSLLADSAT
ncbi:uncharacterized protein SPPG_05898 [Spizellomyces punctatus DAOM BR117]|uniref:SH3 domain-containing protein n=1 Tax=Spizellomyces punctatus (strain DAOM BR117) TaxID=645134 RepID=A0A0L0HD46_SPIPD|nr:uncharacterized protein SPPG_05898 [Spizellomyces punctatus DAOM BR117]KNC98936.1 hypothetical protein SPPG_05898 [Spizellomyces punctatus DAOM BR117]|eukprot:XP_016606976.1 hypothetical protein SPPG_05898 [Spizellomyces punctatus DAOM BR117]